MPKRKHKKRPNREGEQGLELQQDFESEQGLAGEQEPELEQRIEPQQRKVMELGEIINQAKKQLTVLHPLPVSGVIGAAKREDGWHVIIELIERKGIPDAQDLLGVYEAVLDEQGNLVSYQRKKVRHRSDTTEETES